MKPAWAMPDDPAAEALLKAAFEGDLDGLKAALAKGTPVEAKSERGFTALNLAASGNHPEAVKILLAAKADVNAQNKRNGASALHIAADTGNHEVVKMLIEAKADVNLKDLEGRTPLSVTRSDKVKKLLEKAGAK